MKRSGFGSERFHGATSSVDLFELASKITTLKKVIEEYPFERVLNFDETVQYTSEAMVCILVRSWECKRS